MMKALVDGSANWIFIHHSRVLDEPKIPRAERSRSVRSGAHVVMPPESDRGTAPSESRVPNTAGSRRCTAAAAAIRRGTGENLAAVSALQSSANGRAAFHAGAAVVASGCRRRLAFSGIQTLRFTILGLQTSSSLK